MNWHYVIIALIVIIVLVCVIKSHKSRKLQQEQEKIRREQEERQKNIAKKIEQDNRKMQESASKAQSEYDRIEAAIASNPLSAKYRRETQQQSSKFSFVDIDKFIMQAPKRFIAVDLETTGLSAQDDQIIEIAAVKVVNGKIAGTYNQLIDPCMPIPVAASEVNHITDEMVSGMPKIYEVIPNFLEFVGNDMLVAHNAKFDAKFMTLACMRYRFKVYKKWFDSMELKAYWPDIKNRKLQTFLDAAGIANDDAHRAESDAVALANLVLKTLEKIEPITDAQ